MTTHTLRMLNRTALVLMLGAVVGVTAAAAQDAVAVVKYAADAANHAAELGRQKDIVWLSLVVAIVSMMLAALKDYWVSKTLIELRDDLKHRPCVVLGAKKRAEEKALAEP